ncbi:MAG: DUF1232 domain-containing protein [Synergistaceae bacterium]|nr:DUF1232 domain-containing protein [Synergistaceae bacterium]
MNDAINSMEILKKLKELLDIGALTQEEFDRKKAEFMNSVSFTQTQQKALEPEIPEVIDAEFKSAEDLDPKYGKEYSEDSFWNKITSVIKSAGLEIIYKALQLYYAMQNPSCPLYIKTAIVAALGYFISPIDLIPDFIPVVGFTDDLAAIGSALVMAHAFIDDNVKFQARQMIDNLFGEGTSLGLN